MTTAPSVTTPTATIPSATIPSATARPDTLAEVRDVLVRVLGIEDRAAAIDADTALLGELPELDSLGVVELAQALENRFDVVVDDDDFTAEVFATVGSLAAFVDSRSS